MVEYIVRHIEFIVPALLVCLAAAAPVFISWRKTRHLDRLCAAIAGDGGTRKMRDWLDIARWAASPLAGGKERRRLSRKLAEAGYFHSHHLDLFLLLKLVILLLAIIPCLLWMHEQEWQIFSSPMSLFKGLGLMYVAVRVPDWLLADRARQRRNRIEANLPQAFDLLTICTESGLSLEDSLMQVADDARKAAPEIADEFLQTRSELLISTNRQEVIQRLGSRSKVKALELLSSTLVQSMQYGTPLVEALRLMAKECRDRQIAALEEKAGKMSARVGVPLIVFILLPLVVITLTPAMVALMRTLGASKG